MNLPNILFVVNFEQNCFFLAPESPPVACAAIGSPGESLGRMARCTADQAVALSPFQRVPRAGAGARPVP